MCIDIATLIAGSPKPTSKELMVLLYHTAAHKWREIGTLLDIPDAKLDIVSGRYKEDPQKSLMEVCKIWLSTTDPTPTWEMMAEAVGFVGLEDVAQKIREKYHVS